MVRVTSNAPPQAFDFPARRQVKASLSLLSLLARAPTFLIAMRGCCGPAESEA